MKKGNSRRKRYIRNEWKETGWKLLKEGRKGEEEETVNLEGRRGNEERMNRKTG